MAAVVRAAWLIERDAAIAGAVSRAVADVDDGWTDVMEGWSGRCAGSG